MTPLPTDIDNRGASIGTQVVAERVYFGGEMPAAPEREALRRQIASRFGEAVERGEIDFDARVEVDRALQRLLGPCVEWTETSDSRIVSVTVPESARGDLRLPLELLRPPTGSKPVVVRCALNETETIPEDSKLHPEGGRIVLATASGAALDADLLEVTQQVCRDGLHLASDGHDRERGAFDAAQDHVSRVSRSALRQALRPRDDRPGAAVLLLVFHVQEGGLCLHDDDSGEQILVGAEGLAAVLGPAASHLRLVVLVPVADRSEGDPGRSIVDVATALHRRGMAAVVAPRVPLPTTAVPEMTAVLLGNLLGNTRVPPRSLESALARVGEHLSTQDGLARLGLRLYARASDGDDTRPLVIRPYRGLLAFEPEHARFYVGREDETAEVVQRIAQLGAQNLPGLVLLVGASGVGKSSLAKAGVAPAMARDGWATVLTRPARHSTAQLAALVEGTSAEQTLVVVDQLEELFAEGDSDHYAGYLQHLWTLANRDGVAVIAVLRIDALEVGGETRIEPGGRTLEQLIPGPHAVFVHHLDADALRRVITEPARHVGLTLDTGLVDRLCDEALAEPGALPMLELVLDELWSGRRGRTMSAAGHDGGGLAERLARYADECVGRLPEEQKAHARRILVRIATGPVVELKTWRRRSTLDALRPASETQRVAFAGALAALVEARLIVRGDLRRSGSSRTDVDGVAESVELAHELLLRHWSTLRKWIDEEAPRLAALRNLEHWVADRREHQSTLLTAEQLAYVERASLDTNDLNESMLELMAASRKAAHRRRWFQRAVVGGLVVATFAFVGLSGWALDQRWKAEFPAAVAEQAKLHAQEQRGIAKSAEARAQEQKDVADIRLDAAQTLANTILFNSLPKLEHHPNGQALSKEIHDRLQRMMKSLHVPDTDDQYQWTMGHLHMRNGLSEWRTGNFGKAHAEYEQAVDIAAELVNRLPDGEQARHYLHSSLIALGRLDSETGDVASARALFERSLQATEEWTDAIPHSPFALRGRHLSLRMLGGLEQAAGDLATARRHLLHSLDLSEKLINGEHRTPLDQRDLVYSLLGLSSVEFHASDFPAAREHLTRSVAVGEELANNGHSGPEDDRNHGESLLRLGIIEYHDGATQAAREHIWLSLTIGNRLMFGGLADPRTQRNLIGSHQRLSRIATSSGDREAASEHIQRALTLSKGLVNVDAPAPVDLRNYAESLQLLAETKVLNGDIESALDHLDTAATLISSPLPADQRLLAAIFYRLGTIEQDDANLEAARDHLQRTVDITQNVANSDSRLPQDQRDLSLRLYMLGYVEWGLGNRVDARDHLRQALGAAEKLVSTDSPVPADQRQFTLSLLILAELELQEGDLTAGRDLLQRAPGAHGESPSAKSLEPREHGLDFLFSQCRGRLAMRAGDLELARDHFQRSTEHLARLENADSAETQRNLAYSYGNRGDVEVLAGNLAGAREHYQHMHDVADRLVKATPRDIQNHHLLAFSLSSLGEVELEAGDLSSARTYAKSALKKARRLSKMGPPSAQTKYLLSTALLDFSEVQRRSANLKSARRLSRESLEVAEGLIAEDPDSIQYHRILSTSLQELGEVDLEAGQWDAARERLRAALELREKAASMAPSDALIAFDVVDTLNSLADLAEQQGDHEALRHAVTTAIERLEVMDQKGQISGYSEHQSIRDSLRRRADQLKQPADLEVVAP